MSDDKFFALCGTILIGLGLVGFIVVEIIRAI